MKAMAHRNDAAGGAARPVHRWIERRQRRAAAWWGARFRPLPGRGPGVALFCDFEGHYAGPDGERFAEAGLERLLEMTARLGIRMTFNVVAELCVSHPRRIERLIEAGHEIACHGWRHERPREMPADEMDRMLLRALGCFEKLGLRPAGFRSPESAWSVPLLRSLARHGFAWNAERDFSDRPYRIGRGLVRVPVRTDDWDLADGRAGVIDVMTKWYSAIERTIHNRGIIGLGVHEWIVGRNVELFDALGAFLLDISNRGVQCRSLREAACLKPLVAEVAK